MADREQQGTLALQHAVQAASHRVDLGREFTEFVAAAHRDGLREIPAAITLRTRADVVQRPEQAAHRGIGRPGQQQQAAQRQHDAPGVALAPVHVAQAEADAVAVGGGAGQDAGAIVVLTVVMISLRALLVPRGVGGPPHGGPLDAHRDRQPRHQGLRPRHLWRRSDFAGQAVDIVREQRLHQHLVAAAEHHAGTAQEDHGAGHGQQQEQGDQAPAQRMAEAPVPMPRVSQAARPGALAAAGSRAGPGSGVPAHQALRTPAKV